MRSVRGVMLMTTGILIREYANIVVALIALIYATVKLLRCKRLFTHLNFESENAKKVINIIFIFHQIFQREK